MTTESKLNPADGGNLKQVLEATSFLSGANAKFIESLYRQYLESPEAVDPEWREFFAALHESKLTPTQLGRGPAWARDAKFELENGELVSALTGAWAAQGAAASPESARAAALDSIHLVRLIRTYRTLGHLEANLDPLHLEEKKPIPQLQPSFYGLGEADMERPIALDGVLGLEQATPRETLQILRRTYCGTIGYEYMHITDPEQRDWIQRRIEGWEPGTHFTPEGKKAILNKLIEADEFEKFCAVKFVGTKRFGLDGGEAMIPALEQIIKRGGHLGVKEIVLGMSHRGRLNVLTNVMAKPYHQIFHEFHGGSSQPSDVQGSGDVKYHLGASSDREFDGYPRASFAHRQPIASGSVRSRGAGQGARQAGAARRQADARLGAAAAVAWRRRVRRPGRGGGMLRHVGNQGLPHRRHHPFHRQQPDRLHHRADLMRVPRRTRRMSRLWCRRPSST